MRDLDGRSVLLLLNSVPGGVFQADVFFGQNARLSPKQTSAQSVLLLNRADFAYISRADVTAFDDDFQLFTEDEFKRVHVSGADQMRVLVWKFPTDLNDIPGYTPVYNIPLPVDSYFLQDDGGRFKTNHKTQL